MTCPESRHLLLLVRTDLRSRYVVHTVMNAMATKHGKDKRRTGLL